MKANDCLQFVKTTDHILANQTDSTSAHDPQHRLMLRQAGIRTPSVLRGICGQCFSPLVFTVNFFRIKASFKAAKVFQAQFDSDSAQNVNR